MTPRLEGHRSVNLMVGFNEGIKPVEQLKFKQVPNICLGAVEGSTLAKLSLLLEHWNILRGACNKHSMQLATAILSLLVKTRSSTYR
jgi:hypothetical protein